MADVRAFQKSTRQSPYKMRLVIDQVRGKSVNDALAILRFSKKHAARQIEKTLHSAVANAEYKGRLANEPVDVDTLYIKHAIINEGPKLKRFTPAAMGRATPMIKRTSHVEIVLAPHAVRTATPAKRPAAARAAESGGSDAAKAAPKKESAAAARPKAGRKRTAAAGAGTSKRGGGR
jgi:large subunit ribosomal protein L22